MIRKIFCLTLAMIGMAAWMLDSACASTHEFFTGKTAKILVGASAGGAFDTWGRMVGRHLGKQIPWQSRCRGGKRHGRRWPDSCQSSL